MGVVDTIIALLFGIFGLIYLMIFYEKEIKYLGDDSEI